MNKNSKKLFSYILIISSLFIVLLVTKDLIIDVQDTQNSIESKINEITKQKEKVQKLKALQIKIKTNPNPELQRYTTIPSEDVLVNYFYSLIENWNTNKVQQIGDTQINLGDAQILSISLSKTRTNDLGFLETGVTLNLVVEKEVRLKFILSELISEQTPFKFFIESLAYENWDFPIWSSENNEPISVSIPLKVFYK